MPRNRPRFALQLAAFALLATACPSDAAQRLERPNVLFIAVDDSNHWVGHLGRNRQTKTPYLDRMAKMGTTFTRAYCAAPVCNPSRATPNRSLAWRSFFPQQNVPQAKSAGPRRAGQQGGRPKKGNR